MVLTTNSSISSTKPSWFLFKLLCAISLETLSGFNNKFKVISLAVSTAPKASNSTPKSLLKDSLVLPNPIALGGNKSNFSFGIAISSTIMVFKTACNAILSVIPETLFTIVCPPPLTA